MWTVSATDTGVFDIIFAEAKVHAFRFLNCPGQMPSWSRIRQHLQGLRAQPNQQTVLPRGLSITLPLNIFAVRIFCDCGHIHGTFIVSLSNGSWQSMATVS